MRTHLIPTRSRLAGLAAAVLAATVLAVTPTAEGQTAPRPVDARHRVHWADGKALGRAGLPPSRAVKQYLDSGAGDTLRPTSRAWTVRGVTYLRMEQYVAGLRVAGSDAKAAFDARGRLVSLVENTVRATDPRAASASEGDALRAAVRSLYPGGSPRWLQAPSVEKVALPMSDGRLSEGYVVLTWDADNQLFETVVAGNGSVVRSESRTSSEGYNVFPEHPDETPQTVVTDPADPAASPDGWLVGDQWSNHISGNNAHAYIDADNDDAPDPNDEVEADGVFDTAFDATTQPTAGDNPDVAVQNLFYFNNLIHDTLYRAGFTEAAGNFQNDTFGNGGTGGDAVEAQAQDGGGTDNANFATPPDGQPGRMQMYLWTPPGGYDVIQNGVTYSGAPASFGAQLDTTGVTGPLAVADDGVGTGSDGCEALPAVAAGTVVLVDRGTCNFSVKAVNVQRAGGSAMLVVNNVPGPAVPMGGGKGGRIKIPSLMVSQDDGAVLRAGAPAATTLRLSPTPPPFKDGDLDSDIIWHEYGHGLTWRMIGSMSGPMSGAIGEGMADVLSVITGDDPVVAEYPFSDAGGIRRFSYEGYPNTYADVTGTEVHDDGELYGAIGWDLWKAYKAASLGQDDILADLVGGMNFTPAGPNFEQMRDGILMGLTASGNDARACMVWRSFAKYGVGVGATSRVRGPNITATESFAVPPECAAP
ncbi:peptidase M36 [Nocardioides immobilis]|uniref:Peptidase M36 n=1 Tax=Nocardioides immobilis TaxID=2049295 RepID=A0A417XWY1_9ACTN|nr:M36 family metallopeptidase [Nocardioides immobilis]RHW24781.1 peptidase M36 [Nocardioides immobilis]